MGQPPRHSNGRPVVLRIGSRNVQIPVTEQAYTNFVNQFKQNTEAQQDRYKTLMTLMRAAYSAGLAASSPSPPTPKPSSPEDLSNLSDAELDNQIEGIKRRLAKVRRRPGSLTLK